MTILELDDDFQKHLQEDHYSFVAPINPDLFDQFIKTVSKISPSGFFGTVHNSLSDRAAARQALQYFPNAEFRIYIMVSRQPSLLAHSSLHEYCKQMNIEYP